MSCAVNWTAMWPRREVCEEGSHSVEGKPRGDRAFGSARVRSCRFHPLVRDVLMFAKAVNRIRHWRSGEVSISWSGSVAQKYPVQVGLARSPQREARRVAGHAARLGHMARVGGRHDELGSGYPVEAVCYGVSIVRISRTAEPAAVPPRAPAVCTPRPPAKEKRCR